MSWKIPHRKGQWLASDGEWVTDGKFMVRSRLCVIPNKDLDKLRADGVPFTHGCHNTPSQTRTGSECTPPKAEGVLARLSTEWQPAENTQLAVKTAGGYGEIWQGEETGELSIIWEEYADLLVEANPAITIREPGRKGANGGIFLLLDSDEIVAVIMPIAPKPLKDHSGLVRRMKEVIEKA